MWVRAFRFELHDTDRIPGTGGAVLVANHASVVDHFVTAAATPRDLANLAHKEAFDHWFLGRFLRLVGAIPVARQGGDDDAIAAAVEHVRNGGLVCIYPEGDWSPDGKVYRFRTGFARIAQRAEAPVIPCGIRGSLERRKGNWFRTGGPVSIHVGQPRWIEPSEDARGVADAIQLDVAQLAAAAAAPSYVQEQT